MVCSLLLGGPTGARPCWKGTTMFHWKAKAVATVAVMVAVLAGCTNTAASTSASPSAAADGTLVIGQFLPQSTFDVTQAEWGNRALYYQAVYDTLLVGTSEGTIEPYLAKEFTYNDTNTVLTLKLRDDVKFTDGTMLDANLVKQNLERFKNGGGGYATDLAGVTSIEAPDASTVVLTLSAPDPALTAYLSREAGLMAAASMFDAADAATNPVGSGPYILDTATTVTGTSYVFDKNPDYWNPEAQHYAKIIMSVFADPTAVISAIKAGEVDTAILTDNNNLTEVEAAGFTILASELNFAGLLLLDRAGTQNPAMGDVRVRQAINYALDRPGLLEALQLGNGTVTTQVFKSTSGAYDPALDSRYPFDPQKAKDLLAEAGYAGGLDITMPSTVVLGAAQFPLVQQELADVGINITWVDTPVENYIADFLAPKYAAGPMQLEENPDWQLINFMIAPTAPWNPFKYGDDTTARLISEIQNGDLATQVAKARELNAYIVEQAWFAPYYRVSAGYAFNPAKVSVVLNPSNIVPSLYDFKPAS
jgi:peptide/nickel transport system substrate-binding protein